MDCNGSDCTHCWNKVPTCPCFFSIRICPIMWRTASVCLDPNIVVEFTHQDRTVIGISGCALMVASTTTSKVLPLPPSLHLSQYKSLTFIHSMHKKYRLDRDLALASFIFFLILSSYVIVPDLVSRAKLIDEALGESMMREVTGLSIHLTMRSEERSLSHLRFIFVNANLMTF